MAIVGVVEAAESQSFDIVPPATVNEPVDLVVLVKTSVTVSVVLSALYSVTLNEAAPAVNVTALCPEAQPPWAGYVGAVPPGLEAGPENVRHRDPE